MNTLADSIGGKQRIIGGPFGSNLTQKDYVLDGVPVIRGSNMEHDGRWIGGSFAFVDENKGKSLSSNIARPGDIVVTQRGTLGQVSIIPINLGYEFYIISQSQMAIAVDNRLANPFFVYYFLKSSKFHDYIKNTTIQTGVPHINLGILRDAPVLWPSLDVQQKIAGVLSSLDDKIELNQRMNETLEAMAQAIFRDWFVDFGPTRRKMAGATNPLEIMGGLVMDTERAQQLADLFPAMFGTHGLPEGWESKPLLDQAHWINGAAYKNMHFSDDDDALPVVKIAELKNGVTSNTKRTNTALGEKYKISDGDLLFSWSGNPDTSIDAFVWTGGEAWLNQHIFAVRENGTRSKPALYILLKSLMPQFAELARNKQTTGLGHITKDDMKRLEIATAPEPVNSAFNELVDPLFGLLVNKLLESRTLAATRDILLPKLMSGEIRIKDAEDMVEAAQ